MIKDEYIKEFILSDERFSSSHGARPQFNNIGLGMLYYAMAYTHPGNCVCLGSGSGFVPRLMVEGQADACRGSNGPWGTTTLVDANLPELGYGTTDYYDPAKPTTFTKCFGRFLSILKMRSHDAAGLFKDITYLHIDADHSYAGTKSDLRDYLKLMVPDGVVTVHDTINRAPNLGVWKALRELRADKVWEMVEFRQGMGTVLLKRRMSDE